jgi:hypothetical protein
MFNRDPFEVRTEVLFHTFHRIGGQTTQIRQVAKLRGDDQLPQALIASCLPVFKPVRNVDFLVLAAKAHALYGVFMCGALACQVSPVRLPLPARLVVQIGHPDGATLQVRTRVSPFPPEVPRLRALRVLRA